MFKHKTIPFGKYTKHVLCNQQGEHLLEVVPEVGTCMTGLVLKGISVLDVYNTPEEADFNKWYKNMVLFPFPNRMKDGQYEWQGNSYQFDINDAITNTALHGIGFDKLLHLEAVETEGSNASLSFVFEYDGQLAGYPFPFLFRVKYQLIGHDTFEVQLEMTNMGAHTIPAGFGWHPYFQLSEKVDDMVLHLPPCELIGVDSQMIPTGKRYDFDSFEQPTKIGITVLDNCFALSKIGERAEIVLKGEKGTLHYWQETGPGKFNFIQLFTPPHRQSLALEPVTCNIDAFNNQDGLIELLPGTTASASFGFSLKR